MAQTFVLQKKNANGYRRFIISDEKQAKAGGTTGNHGRAMQFDSKQKAELFLSLNTLFGFTIAEYDGTDDMQEEAREYWKRNRK